MLSECFSVGELFPTNGAFKFLFNAVVIHLNMSIELVLRDEMAAAQLASALGHVRHYRDGLVVYDRFSYRRG